MKYRCGCVIEVSEPYGVLRSVQKCRKHKAEQRDPAELDEAYYRSNGVFEDGFTTRHAEQLTEALGPIPTAPIDQPYALEIGCGVSFYVEAIRAAGYTYLGADKSTWAVNWMRRTYGIHAATYSDFESVTPRAAYSFILAPHVIEHLVNAPGAILRCAQWLLPGGQLWIVIPDDSDPLNPDHLWFFNEQTLTRCIEAAGLKIERTALRKYIERESFIYCGARKP